MRENASDFQYDLSELEETLNDIADINEKKAKFLEVYRKLEKKYFNNPRWNLFKKELDGYGERNGLLNNKINSGRAWEY